MKSRITYHDATHYKTKSTDQLGFAHPHGGAFNLSIAVFAALDYGLTRSHFPSPRPLAHRRRVGTDYRIYLFELKVNRQTANWHRICIGLVRFSTALTGGYSAIGGGREHAPGRKPFALARHHPTAGQHHKAFGPEIVGFSDTNELPSLCSARTLQGLTESYGRSPEIMRAVRFVLYSAANNREQQR